MEESRVEVRFGDLDARQAERLRQALIAVLADQLSYPPFFAHSAGRLLARPVDRPIREACAAFVASVNFGPIERAQLSSPDVRRFLERLLLRYLEVNSAFAQPRYARHLPALRRRASQLATELQRGMVAYLQGQAPTFGAAAQPRSWAEGRRPPRHSQDDLERSTRILEAALVRSREESPPPATSGSLGASRPGAAPRRDAPAWGGDETVPVPASGYSGFGLSSPSTVPPAGERDLSFARGAVSDQPTGPVRNAPAHPGASGNGAYNSAPGQGGASGALYDLYGDYLRDMHPEVTATHPVASAPAAAPRDRLPTAYQPPAPPPAAFTDQDQAVFLQLRYQLVSYIQRAAESYGLTARTADPFLVLEVLRRSRFVDESDLRLAESILALTDRVLSANSATVDDYRQAFMLYLLYHRSHLGI